MSAVNFVVPGRVGGKGRPRMVVINGHARAVTPTKTRATEAMLREIAERAMRATGNASLLEGPLSLQVRVELSTPKSWPKKKRASALHVTGKPDCDNQIKLICDAMNGVVYRDDSQITQIYFDRKYVGDGHEAVWVHVGELGK